MAPCRWLRRFHLRARLGGKYRSQAPRFSLDSQVWNASDESTDTLLTGDTSVLAVVGREYDLKFVLYRKATNKTGSSDFHGVLIYQLWSGHPDRGGILIGAAEDQPSDPADLQESIALRLRAKLLPRMPAGILHLRFETRRLRKQGTEPFAYQQAELTDIVLTAP